MSTCAGAPAEQFASLYVEGVLNEAEMNSFEEHFFDCPVCLAHVQTLQAVAQHFAQQSAQQQRAPVAAAPQRKSLLSWPAPIWRSPVVSFMALAAVAIIAVLGYRMLPSHNSPAPVAVNTPPAQPAPPSVPVPVASAPDNSVIQLADLTMPSFKGATLRGESGDPHFAAGMKAFARNDCKTAVPALAQVDHAQPEARAALFYTGLCQLHQQNLTAAHTSFTQVAAQHEAPEQEASLFYLAQLALLHNDAATAQRNLEHTIALHGDFERRARKQLVALKALPSTK